MCKSRLFGENRKNIKKLSRLADLTLYQEFLKLYKCSTKVNKIQFRKGEFSDGINVNFLKTNLFKLI